MSIRPKKALGEQVSYSAGRRVRVAPLPLTLQAVFFGALAFPCLAQGPNPVTITVAETAEIALVDILGLDGQVLIDGEPRGVAPVSIRVPYGKHTLIIKKDGYEDLVKVIDVREPVFKLNLEAEAPPKISTVMAGKDDVRVMRKVGSVKVISRPADVEVRIGDAVGRTTCLFSPISQGWQLITIDGNKKHVFVHPDRMVTVRYDQDTQTYICEYPLQVDIKLLSKHMKDAEEDAIVVNVAALQELSKQRSAEPNQLSVITVPPKMATVDIIGFDGEVLLDGESVGVAPLSIDVPYGMHRFTFRKSGWEETTVQVDINKDIHKIDLREELPGEVITHDPGGVSIRLKAQTGSLMVTSVPPGLATFFGGITGTTTSVLDNIPQGQHDIEVDGHKRRIYIYAQQRTIMRYHQDTGRFVVTYPPGFLEKRLNMLAEEVANDALLGNLEAIREKREELDTIGTEASLRQGFNNAIVESTLRVLREDPPAIEIAVKLIGEIALEPGNISKEKKVELDKAFIGLVKNEFSVVKQDYEASLLRLRKIKDSLLMISDSPTLQQRLNDAMLDSALAMLKSSPAAIEIALALVREMGPEAWGDPDDKEKEFIEDLVSQFVARLSSGQPDYTNTLDLIKQARDVFSDTLPDDLNRMVLDTALRELKAGRFAQAKEIWLSLAPEDRDLSELKKFLSNRKDSFDSMSEAKQYYAAIEPYFPELSATAALMMAQLAEEFLGKDEAIPYYDAVVNKAPGSPEAKIAGERAATITYWRDFSFANLFFFICVAAALIFAAVMYLKRKRAEAGGVKDATEVASNAAANWLHCFNLFLPHGTSLEAFLPQIKKSVLAKIAMGNILAFAVLRGMIGPQSFAVNFLWAVVISVGLLLFILIVIAALGAKRKPPLEERLNLCLGSSFIYVFLWIPTLGPVLAVLWWFWFANNLLFAAQREAPNAEADEAQPAGAEQVEPIAAPTFSERFMALRCAAALWCKALIMSMRGSLDKQDELRKMPREAARMFVQVNIIVFALAHALRLQTNLLENLLWGLLIAGTVSAAIGVIMVILAKAFKFLETPFYLMSLASVVLLPLWIPVIGIIFCISYAVWFSIRVHKLAAPASLATPGPGGEDDIEGEPSLPLQSETSSLTGTPSGNREESQSDDSSRDEQSDNNKI